MTLSPFAEQLQAQADHYARLASGQLDRRSPLTLHLRGGQSFRGWVLHFGPTAERDDGTRHLVLALDEPLGKGQTVQIALEHIAALSVNAAQTSPVNAAPMAGGSGAAGWTKLALARYGQQLAQRLLAERGLNLVYQVQFDVLANGDGTSVVDATVWQRLAQRLDDLHGVIWAIASTDLGREALAEKVSQVVLQALPSSRGGAAADSGLSYGDARIVWCTDPAAASVNTHDLRVALEALL